MRAQRLWLFWMGVGLLPSLAAPCQAQNKPPDPRVVKVLSDWQKRQNNLASVRYVVHGELVIPKGTMTDDFGKAVTPASPSKDISCPIELTFLFEFSTGRFRIESLEQSYISQAQQFYQRVKNVAFNGTVVKYAFPREANTNSVYSPPPDSPDVAMYTGNLAGFRFEQQYYYPLFFAHGIVPTAEQQIVAGRFKEKLNAGYFRVHGAGMHAGRRCLVLRTETLQLATSSFDEFWIDEGRQSAILRYTLFSGNKPFTDTIIDYDKTKQGWLPKSWTVTSFHGDRTHLVWRMKVDNLTLEPSFADADFDIEIKPGMRVEEIRFPDSPNPLYVPEPQTTNFVQGESRIGAALSSSLRVRSSWPWLVVGLGFVAVVLTWFYSRRRRRLSL